MKNLKKQIKSHLLKGLMASALGLFCASVVVAQRIEDVDSNVIEQRVEKLERIFTVVEQMPRFPGCEGMTGTDEEKQSCANQKMMDFIAANLQYPAAAKEGKIEGMVVASFTVNEDGSISRAQIARPLGGGCDEETLRVINLMNEMPERWTAGKQKNEAVKVRMTLPLKFSLK